jgi:hypothetical protein
MPCAFRCIPAFPCIPCALIFKPQQITQSHLCLHKHHAGPPTICRRLSTATTATVSSSSSSSLAGCLVSQAALTVRLQQPGQQQQAAAAAAGSGNRHCRNTGMSASSKSVSVSCTLKRSSNTHAVVWQEHSSMAKAIPSPTPPPLHPPPNSSISTPPAPPPPPHLSSLTTLSVRSGGPCQARTLDACSVWGQTCTQQQQTPFSISGLLQHPFT